MTIQPGAFWQQLSAGVPASICFLESRGMQFSSSSLQDYM